MFFSGIAVVISLGGLLTLGISLFTSMAVGTMGVVTVSVIGSLTFLPATLAIVGDRVNMAARDVAAQMRAGFQSARSRPWRRGDGRPRPPGNTAAGQWVLGRLVNAVMGRPVILTILSAAVLLAIASPALRLRTGTTEITGLPSSIDGIAGVKLIDEKFPFGQDLTLDLVITQPSRPDVRAAIDQLETKAIQIPGLGGPPTERLSQDGSAILVSFTMTGGRNDEANHAIVRQVRNDIEPQLFGGLKASGVQVYVAGEAAHTMDIVGIYSDASRGSSCSCSGCRSC